MPTTTLRAIREHSPCRDGWAKLLKHLGKSEADDEPLPLLAILDSNGLDDALWCLRAIPEHDRHWRLLAVWLARQVQHLMTDPRSLAALDVAERHAHGLATDAELDAAAAAARNSAWAVTANAAGDAAACAAASAAVSAAWTATADTAGDAAACATVSAAAAAAWTAAEDAAECAAAAAAAAAAWTATADAAGDAAACAARAAAMSAAVDGAERRLREVCAEIDAEVQQ